MELRKQHPGGNMTNAELHREIDIVLAKTPAKDREAAIELLRVTLKWLRDRVSESQKGAT